MQWLKRLLLGNSSAWCVSLDLFLILSRSNCSYISLLFQCKCLEYHYQLISHHLDICSNIFAALILILDTSFTLSFCLLHWSFECIHAPKHSYLLIWLQQLCCPQGFYIFAYFSRMSWSFLYLSFQSSWLKWIDNPFVILYNYLISSL